MPNVIGLFSLICLLIQCILAWICTGLLLVLAREPSPWLRRWRAAFVALAVALTAVALRFFWAQWQHDGNHVMHEGAVWTRFGYGVYVAGKVAFVWYLVGGVAALRQQRWPRARWVAPAVVGIGFVAGFVATTIETTLLLQAPLVAAAFGRAVTGLRSRPGEAPDSGRTVLQLVLVLWALAWLLHGTAVALVHPLQPTVGTFWNTVLQFNSLIDLSLQVPLAVVLMVVVVDDVQRRVVDARRERDRLRERVERADKLRSLSTLVGGIAHELNNPLTAILGHAGELDAADAATRTHAARVVAEQAERCRAIVQRVSAMGGRRAFVRREVRVDELVRRVVSGLDAQLRGGNVLVDVALAAGPHAVVVDGAAIEQVLSNLVCNAVQACPPGGRVVVGTAIVGDRLRFFVDDTGPGVPVADRERIFEPFWTSKRSGTGIGLAVAATLVEAHESRIEVSDAALGGARFAFDLPFSTPTPMVQDKPPAANRVFGLGHLVDASVLVVDDEPDVRSAIRRHLEGHGFRVEEAGSGAQALARLLRTGERFAVIVCDLRMPEMSGPQLYDAVQARAPRLAQRFLFVSADLVSHDARAFAARCPAPILGKPFAGDELVAHAAAIAAVERRDGAGDVAAG